MQLAHGIALARCLAMKTRLERVAISLVALASWTLFALAACGPSNAGTQCDSDDECDGGMECITHQTGAICSGGSCGCDYQQSICTQACESDDDCPEDMACNRSSSCGGSNDLCGRS
jgi:hypothetical protein